jgi:Tfp pilus assembly protein PilX
MIDTFLSRLSRSASEDGFMLLEVVISALLVGLIAVGTLSGLDSAGRASGDERAHAQATVIAQQDEERLRGLTVTQLAQLGSSTQTLAENGLCIEEVSGAWRYLATAALEKSASCEKTAVAYSHSGGAYTAIAFTVTSSTQYVTASKETFTCETEKGTADYIQTTSAVTWAALGSRPEVKQSSLVNVPAGNTLLVKVKNRNNEPVEGATVKVTGTATNATQTTPSAGCVVFGAITDSKVKVVAENGTWVDHNGKSPPPQLEEKLSTTAVTEANFTIEAPGSIDAEFESNGASVESLTFDVLHPSEMSFPEFFVGGSASTTSHSAELTGVFPFVTPGTPFTPSKYTVFAGDCEANNPASVTSSGEKIVDRSAQVEPNLATTVKVEAPAVNVTVDEGENASKPESHLASSVSAKVVNTECAGKAAQNYATVPYEHAVTITSGALVQKYLPYAKKLELCVVGKLGSTYYKSKATFANTAKAGTAPFFFYLKATGFTKNSSALSC